MTSIIKTLFGYWEVWHIVLSMALFMWIFFARWPMNYLWKLTPWKPFKQLTFVAVILIAVLWEILESQWNSLAYPNFKAFLLNSYKDYLAALVGALICTFIIPDRRRT